MESPEPAPLASFSWSGAEESFLDRPVTTVYETVVIGRYGGRTDAGAQKNEDGALVMRGDDWEFALILDGHSSADSVDLMLGTVTAGIPRIAQTLSGPVNLAFPELQASVIALLSSESFRARCAALRGEAACLICARKDGFLWWLSVGDCLLYVLHPDLVRFGQYMLNQRSFFEWVGRVNSLDLPVACYSTGVRELRRGHSRILLLTDGLIEHGSRHFMQPENINAWFTSENAHGIAALEDRVEAALRRVHDEHGRDSAAVIAWDCWTDRPVSEPSS